MVVSSIVVSTSTHRHVLPERCHSVPPSPFCTVATLRNFRRCTSKIPSVDLLCVRAVMSLWSAMRNDWFICLLVACLRRPLFLCLCLCVCPCLLSSVLRLVAQPRHEFRLCPHCRILHSTLLGGLLKRMVITFLLIPYVTYSFAVFEIPTLSCLPLRRGPMSSRLRLRIVVLRTVQHLPLSHYPLRPSQWCYGHISIIRFCFRCWPSSLFYL